MLIMALTDEQAKSIKDQVFRQIDSSFPEEKKESAKNYISSLNNEQLEEFLVKNKLIKQSEAGEESGSESQNEKESSCIYCMLSSKKVPSVKVYEDEDYLGVLEIKPLSEGHVVMIPKKHISEKEKLPKTALAQAKKIGKFLVKKLGAENAEIKPSDELDHAVIDIIPVYKNQPLSSERKPVSKEQLAGLSGKIGVFEEKKSSKKIKVEKNPEKLKEAIIKLPRRIP